MPIYEYKCGKCKRVFELLRTRDARDQAAACPTCGSERSRLMMSSFAGRVGSGSGSSESVAGSSGCGSCKASSCAGCRRR